MKKLLTHQGVFLVWLVILTLIKWLTNRWSFGLPMLYWWLGAVLGYVFVYLDVWFFELLNNFANAWRWNIKQLLSLVKHVEERDDLVMRSALFVMAWLILGFWTMTSVSNMFSRGLIFGLGTHLAIDIFWDVKQKGLQIDWWFRQIKRRIEDDEKKWFLVLAGLFYLWIAVNL